MNKQFEFYQRGAFFSNLENRKVYNLEQLRDLIIKGVDVVVMEQKKSKKVTRFILAQILFLHHSTSESERLEYIKRRSISSLHNEIRVLAPFENKNLPYYKDL